MRFEKVLVLAMLCVTPFAMASEAQAPMIPAPFHLSALELSEILKNPELAEQFSPMGRIDRIERGETRSDGVTYLVHVGRCAALMRAEWVQDGSPSGKLVTHFDGVTCQ